MTQRSAVAAELTGGLNGAIDVLVAVHEGDEHRLELGRRDVDAALEEVTEVGRVTFGVAPLLRQQFELSQKASDPFALVEVFIATICSMSSAILANVILLILTCSQ